MKQRLDSWNYQQPRRELRRALLAQLERAELTRDRAIVDGDLDTERTATKLIRKLKLELDRV